MVSSKDQENPNFSAFDTLGSLSNDPVLDPGRLGKRSDGTKIPKLYAKPEVKRVLKKPLLYGRGIKTKGMEGSSNALHSAWVIRVTGNRL